MERLLIGPPIKAWWIRGNGSSREEDLRLTHASCKAKEVAAAAAKMEEAAKAAEKASEEQTLIGTKTNKQRPNIGFPSHTRNQQP